MTITHVVRHSILIAALAAGLLPLASASAQATPDVSLRLNEAQDTEDAEALSSPTPARAAHFEIAGGLAALGGTDTGGVALTLGGRLLLGSFSVLRLDVGYGLVGNDHEVQDRWWILPGYALLIPIDTMRLEIGASLGFATSSGYPDLAAFGDAPFNPRWALQLVGAARGHVALWFDLDESNAAFIELAVGTLHLEGNDAGVRHGIDNATAAETVWWTLTVGTTFDVL